MKKFIVLAVIFISVLVALKDKVAISSYVKSDHVNQLEVLQKELEVFQKAIQLKDRAEQKKAFQKLRYAYKIAEPLFTYFSPEANKFYVNGAPLPRLDKNATSIVVIDPQGLQIIEELLYDEANHVKEITTKTIQLQKQLVQLTKYHASIPVYDRHVFEAVRFEVLRIATMGITGFDTPGSSFAIQESEQALSSTYKMMKGYLMKKQENTKELDQLFQDAITYLKSNNDFDTFDRYEFIKTYANPLYGEILDLQLSMGIETIYEVNEGDYAINYNSKEIFSDDFFNKSFYTQYINKYQNAKTEKLGKLLFYDPVLSGNNKRACASCHQPDKGFTDGLTTSLTFDMKGHLTRNSPTILNSVYAERFFHDMRVEKIENQFEHVIISDKEFNTNYGEILAKLNSSEEYKKMFKEVFPEYGDRITKYTFSTALAVFCSSLSGFNSSFDQYISNKTEEEIPQDIKNGFNLFMGKAACATCHFPPSFSGIVPPLYIESESEVLGVPTNTDTIHPIMHNDLGRYSSGRPKEAAPFYKHSFKTPTVRNVAFTSPYMHNGVYTSLEEVVDFYNKGGGVGLGFEIPNQTLPFDNLNLTDQEKKDLVAFMEALNDTSGLTSKPTKLPEFSDHNLNNRIVGGEY